MKKSKIRRLNMLGGSSTWIKAATDRNMRTIYLFLAKKTKDAKKRPRFSYSEIAGNTNVNRRQVQFACQKLAYMNPPVIKITAVKYPQKDRSVKTSEKVTLIRFLEKPKKKDSDAPLLRAKEVVPPCEGAYMPHANTAQPDPKKSPKRHERRPESDGNGNHPPLGDSGIHSTGPISGLPQVESGLFKSKGEIQ